MSLKSRRIATMVSLFLVFAVSQIYLGVSFAGPGSATVASESPGVTQQQPTGILTTHRNKPITVNGSTAISGATILTGADIETPDGVGATVSLGSLGSLQIDPNTKLTLEFQAGSIKVMLVHGCVTLRTKKGTAGEVDSPQGVIGKTDPAKDGVIKVCPNRAAAAVVPAAAGGLFGLGTAASVALVGGFLAEIILPAILAGRNPSPSRP